MYQYVEGHLKDNKIKDIKKDIQRDKQKSKLHIEID